MRADNKELCGPQSPTPVPTRQATVAGIGAGGPQPAVTGSPHTGSEPADDITWAGSDDLQHQASNREIAASPGELPHGNRRADEHEITLPRSRRERQIEADGYAGCQVDDRA